MANNRLETATEARPTASDLFPDLRDPGAITGFLFTNICISLAITAARWPWAPHPVLGLIVTMIVVVLIGTTWAFGLRLLASRFSKLKPSQLYVVAWLLLMAIASLVLGIVAQLMNSNLIQGHFELTPALLLTGAIGGLALRYFYIHANWRFNLERGQVAHSQALSARIRPHFLFNTLNTIAELTRSDAEAAERSVEDLARMYRMGLADVKHRVSLADEVHTAKSYLNIEQYRLGDRMKQVWEIDPDLLNAELPILTLQPLVENGVYHGIEPCPEGGTLHIQGWIVDRFGFLRVTNPMPEFQRSNRQVGNNMAMENIRQRLEMAYGKDANMRAHKLNNQYQVTLRFPCTGGTP